MKCPIFILFTLSIILFTNCSDEQPDCLCTTEFRMYFVAVIDTLGNPVDSLQTKITNSKGKEFAFDNHYPPPNMSGIYFIMSDGYQYDFTTRPEKILFRGNKNSLGVTAEFFFNTDKCRCHVHKVSGPDTLVLK